MQTPAATIATILHTCGHKERVRLTGTRKKQRATSIAAAQEPCSRCREANRSAETVHEERGAVAVPAQTSTTPAQPAESHLYDVVGVVERTYGASLRERHERRVRATDPDAAIEQYALSEAVHGWQVASVTSVTLTPPTGFQRAWK